jgi:putative ABC transport system substrate-binding protein
LIPFWAGLVTSFARPDGNLTGLTGDAGVPFVGKLLELFKEAVPTLSRVAVLGEMLFDSATKELRAATDKGMRTVADTLRLMLLPVEVERPEQLAAAFATFTQRRADGLLVRSTGFTYAHRKLIVDLATKHRLPSMSVPPEIAEVGGLMAYGPSLLDLYRRAAGYVDKILKGAKPGDLPIERPVKFDLVINLKTAKALGLTIPPAVLARADQVIE